MHDKLLTFISERSGVPKAELGADDPLFSAGLMDSMAVLEVTAFVERELGAHFSTADINLDNLDSINRIMSFVDRQRGG